MNCSLEEAFSLFLRPWCENKTTLVLTVDRGLKGSERCTILETSPGKARVRLKSMEVNFDFSSAGFSYEDWRAGLVPELVARKWTCFLLAEFPDDRSLLFSEPAGGLDESP